MKLGEFVSMLLEPEDRVSPETLERLNRENPPEDVPESISADVDAGINFGACRGRSKTGAYSRVRVG